MSTLMKNIVDHVLKLVVVLVDSLKTIRPNKQNMYDYENILV